MNENLLPRLKMESQSTTELCSLCFNFRLESLNSVEMTKKIEKYLQIKMEYSSNGICCNCYSSLEGFHEFYERVHEAQKNFRNKCFTQGVIESQSQQGERDLKADSDKVFHQNAFDTGEKETELSGSQLQKNNESIDALELDKVPDQNEKNDKDSGSAEQNERKDKKVFQSKLKEISSEMEKKMLEFYNIKCEKCEGGKFTSFKMLSKHYTTVHNTQGYIKCCKRNIRVNDKYYLRSHMFKHLQPDSCRCSVCGKELSSLATLKHHMILHKPTEERPFKCGKCEKRFCCKNDLKNHEKAIHVPENEREDYICDVCGKVFQKVANLRYHHSTVHLQERKYICEICAKSFTTQSGLRTHINAAHSTLSPIQCHECNKWLKTKDTFQKHLQLHQNNTYPCAHCDKVCNSSASLRSHLVKHSEERPFSCTFCRKSFKTKTHLKNHSTQHIGGSHYKCPYCSKLFVNMSNYYTHRKRMHSSEKGNDKQEQKAPLPVGGMCQVPGETNRNPEESYDYECKRGKSDILNFNNVIPVMPDVSVMRQNIIVSPVTVKYL